MDTTEHDDFDDFDDALDADGRQDDDGDDFDYSFDDIDDDDYDDEDADDQEDADDYDAEFDDDYDDEDDEDEDDFDYSFDDIDDYDDEDDEYYEDDEDDDTDDAPEDDDEPESYDTEYVAGLRRENARYRTKARDAQKQAIAPLVDAFGDALGDDFDADNATPDDIVAAVADTVKKNRDAVRAARVEAAVYKHANAAGIDAESAMDSRKFYKAVTALDPDARDFDAKIRDAMKGVAGRTTRRNAPPARSGGDFSSGNRSPLSANPSFEELRANRRKKRGLD